jgi:mono/diheme cytochrome c family protein
VRAWAWLAVLLLACGCEKVARNMYEGAKERPMQGRLRDVPAEAAVATGPSTSRPVPADAVERVSGVLAGTSSGRAGVDEEKRRVAAENAQAIPYPITIKLLERGQQRFDIYCEPCHSPLGDGDGMIPRRGFPHPPSYHIARLRQAPDRHFYDVMTNGYGIMYSYADRVTPEDRWAIVAYIRALQRSQGAQLAASAATGAAAKGARR